MGRPPGTPAYEDLTARARIREAAVDLFAEHGVEGTTLRDIAQRAGVSPSLLRHHFGSKDALRDECDAYAFDRLARIKESLILDGPTGPGRLPSVHPHIVLLTKYVTRALLDGSPRAAAMFDDFVELTEQWVGKYAPEITEDRRAYAAVLVGMQSGVLAMHEHVSRVLGADIFTTQGHLRMASALADFYSHPLLDPEFVATARGVMKPMREPHPPTAAGTVPGAEGAQGS